MKGSSVAFIPGTRGDNLKQYLERRSRGADPESATAAGRPLTMRRRTTLALMGCALISVEFWVWTMIVPAFRRAAVWPWPSSPVSGDMAVGLLMSIALVTVIIAAAVMLFTDVDSRGIHRPDWAGGEFIPWTSVTQVATGASPEALQVRAGEKKITLSLMLFSDPAALVALIRRHVPADRLRGF
jgi:hypothetical protein